MIPAIASMPSLSNCRIIMGTNIMSDINRPRAVPGPAPNLRADLAFIKTYR
jgi:hypothetical protein